MYLPYRAGVDDCELYVVNSTPFKETTTAATLKHQAWKLLITSPVHSYSFLAYSIDSIPYGNVGYTIYAYSLLQFPS